MKEEIINGEEFSSPEHFDKLITVIMTTIPSRAKAVLSAIDSIYDQVDEIRIVFNRYRLAPQWARKAPKIKVITDPSNQYTDCAKWQYLPEDGYVFSIDDDIYYPPDYVSTMIRKIEQYKRKAVVTVHGSFFKLPFVNFLESKRSFHFELDLPRDLFIPMIGTGTLAFHLDTIRPEFKDFLSSSRSDIWFSALCIKKQIPMISIQRGRAWLRALATTEETIWNTMMADEKFLAENTRLIKELIIPYVLSAKEVCRI